MNSQRILEEDAETIANSNINWEILDNKTILISGATGYVPQYIVHGLLKHNDFYNSNIKVIALCRNMERVKERFSKYLEREDFHVIIQDVTSRINCVYKIDYIIHAASPAGIINSNADPLTTFDINVKGCENLLTLSQKRNSTFLLFSSVDVYGRGDGNVRFTESHSGILDPIIPRNVYACSKRAAETLCMCYSIRGVDIKIVRPTQIMGGGISLDDGRLHIDLISQILSRNEIIIKGDGSPIRSFIYITDAIIGLLTILTKGNKGEAYNLCNEHNESSVLDFAKTMVKCAYNDVKISYNMETRANDPGVKHAISAVIASSQKLSALGWKPVVDLEESCRRMMNYYGIKTKN